MYLLMDTTTDNSVLRQTNYRPAKKKNKKKMRTSKKMKNQKNHKFRILPGQCTTYILQILSTFYLFKIDLKSSKHIPLLHSLSYKHNKKFNIPLLIIYDLKDWSKYLRNEEKVSLKFTTRHGITLTYETPNNYKRAINYYNKNKIQIYIWNRYKY